jgi:N-acyl-L-homoserine lactone synthetase
MEATTLSYDNLHNHGELFANMFRARHRTFIQNAKWDLPEANGMEFDQYDTPASRWVCRTPHGEVLAGVRLTPTTHALRHLHLHDPRCPAWLAGNHPAPARWPTGCGRGRCPR